MRRFAGILEVFIFFIIFPFPLLSQLIKPKIEFFSTFEGLSNMRVGQIYQDSKGYLWISTADGLNKYDGYTFTVYRQQPYDTTSIYGNSIRNVCEDEHQNLWIATNAGLNYYHRKRNIFHKYYNKGDQKLFLNNNILYVYYSSYKNLWIKTPGGIEILDPKTKTSTPVYTAEGDIALNISQGKSILEDEKGNIWACVNNKLLKFSSNGRKYVEVGLDALKEATHIDLIYLDNDGALVIIVENKIILYNQQNNNVKIFEIKDPNIIITSIVHDKEYWLTTNGGLYKLNKGSGQYEKLNEFIFQENIVSLSNLNTLFKGKKNILWIGGQQGLYKYDLKPKKFNLYNNDVYGKKIFSFESIASIFKRNENEIWVGGWNNGLNIFDREKVLIKHYHNNHPLYEYRLDATGINCIARCCDNQILLGTDQGILRFDSVRTRFFKWPGRYFRELQDTLEKFDVYTIFEEKDSLLWIGTNGGLFRYNVRGNDYLHYVFDSHDSMSISSNDIFCIEKGNNNDLWIGTREGLNRYDIQRGTFDRYLGNTEYAGNSLVGKTINALYLDEEERLWIGTTLGLNCLDISARKFALFTEQEGLANNLVYSIVPGRKDELWMATNKGVSLLRLADTTFVNYSYFDGLQASEYNAGAYHKSDDGEIFFGGVNGFNSFYPDSLKFQYYEAEIDIVSIELVNEKGSQYLNYEKDYNIKIPPGLNVLNISFALMDFTRPEYNTYKYLLEGHSSGWVDLKNRNTITLTNLDAGIYVLHIIGSSYSGLLSKNEIKLTIIVETPFYRTTLAYYLYILLLIAFIYMFIQYRTRRLRKINIELAKKQQIAQQIKAQKEELQYKNKNITDSLIYAQKIQEAMLPSLNLFKKYLPNSFILYKPKAIVSGDFYWITKRKSKVFVAAIDCTGHGVPGAFISIIGNELLRNIIEVQHVDNPAEILEKLNYGIAETLSSEYKGRITLKDGMDVAFCVIDFEKEQLEYAGAFNPLYVVRDNNVTEIKGDRFPVGFTEMKEQKNFINHTVPIQREDVIYLFSDGYADQFGGPEGKKYKYRRFRHLLLTIHKLDMEKQKEILNESIEIWKGDLEQIDDILVIGIKPMDKGLH